MTIRPSIDIATRVSPELSALLEKTAADPDRESPPSLGEVRALLRRRSAAARQTEFLHPSDADSLLAELDALIDEFGPEAGAASFVVSQASEGLSRVIEAVVNDPATPKRPSTHESAMRVRPTVTVCSGRSRSAEIGPRSCQPGSGMRGSVGGIAAGSYCGAQHVRVMRGGTRCRTRSVRRRR